jgi:hypothetical protein
LTRNEARCCEPSDAAVEYYKSAYGEYQRAVETVTTLYA